MKDISAKDLLELEGAGSARKKLIEHGYWNENVETGFEKTFVVTIESSRENYIEVKATTKKEALEKAVEKFQSYYGDSEHIDNAYLGKEPIHY